MKMQECMKKKDEHNMTSSKLVKVRSKYQTNIKLGDSYIEVRYGLP